MAPTMLILVCGDHKMYFDGAGECILKDLPFPVVLLTSRKSAAAFDDCGLELEIHRAQWSDFALVREAAAALARQRPVFAVATVNEALMELAAELRELLDLDGMRPPLAARFRNKLLMKQVLRAAGLRVPDYASCSDRQAAAALLETHPKLVIKPIDGLGSRHVSFVESAAALAAWYQAEPDPAKYEIEEFISGAMYHVNDVVRGGRSQLSASAVYLPGMASIDFSRGRPLVTLMLDDAELRQRLAAYSARIIGALGLVDGITHLECFITPAGEIVLCEIAARPAGGGIIHMIECQHGIHFGRAALLLEGGRGDLLAIGRSEPDGIFGLLGFRASRSGTVAQIAGREHFAEDWISYAALYAQAGTYVRAARLSSDFLCLLVFAAEDHAQFHQRREQLQLRFDAALAYAGAAGAADDNGAGAQPPRDRATPLDQQGSA